MDEKKVLIVDADRASASLLGLRFRQFGLLVRTATDGWQAVELARSERPNLVVLDNMDMPVGSERSLGEVLAANRELDAVPIIVLTNRTDAVTVTRCRELGFAHFQKSITLWGRLKPFVLNVLAIPPTEPSQRVTRPTLQVYGKVLCVDNDPRVTRQLQLRLRDYGIDALREANGVEGFTTAVRIRPNLIITEFALPEGLGSYMLGRLRDCDIQIPVIFLTNVDERAYAGLRSELMELGAACFLQKPVDIQLLMAEVRKHIPLPDELFPQTAVSPTALVLPERTSDHDIAPHIALQTGTRQRSSTDPHLPAPHSPRARTRTGNQRPNY